MKFWRIRSSLPRNGLWELLEMWAEGSLRGFAVSLPCAVDFLGIIWDLWKSSLPCCILKAPLSEASHFITVMESPWPLQEKQPPLCPARRAAVFLLRASPKRDLSNVQHRPVSPPHPSPQHSEPSFGGFTHTELQGGAAERWS